MRRDENVLHDARNRSRTYKPKQQSATIIDVDAYWAATSTRRGDLERLHTFIDGVKRAA